MYSKLTFIALLSLILTVFLMPVELRASEVILKRSQLSHLGIKLATVQTASQESVALVPGTIIPPLNGRTAVATPFAGTVVSVKVLPGQIVKPGDQLMTIASREILEAQSALKQAEAELDATKAVAARFRDLANKKITAKSRALEAEAQVSHAQAKIDSLNRILKLGNISVSNDGTYSLVAAQAGRIVETNVVPGSAISAMAPAVVMDMSKAIWVEAQLPASYVSDVRQGDRIEARSIDGKRIASGKVLSVGHALDRMSRSTKLIGELSKGPDFLVGELVNVLITRTARLGGLEVPSSSVAFIDGAPIIFVRTNNGFQLAPVKLRGKSLKLATIEAKIKPGQLVAVSGLAQLENMANGE